LVHFRFFTFMSCRLSLMVTQTSSTGECGNVIVMCMCVHVARCAMATPMITQLSFFAHLKDTTLVWMGVKSLGCYVTLTYLFSDEVTSLMKIMFVSLYLSICEKTHSRYRTNLNGQVLGNRVWAVKLHQNKPPTLSLPPHLSGRKREKTRKIAFSTCKWNTVQQFVVAKLFV